MTRVVSLFLPTWSTDQVRRKAGGAAPPAEVPLVLIGRSGSRRVVFAADAAASAAGLRVGMPVTKAQVLVPGLIVQHAEPVADAEALNRLATWMLRFTPFVAADPPDGIVIESSGADHLHGGEEAMLDGIIGRLAMSGVVARAAVADTWGAAHALARYVARPLAIAPEKHGADILKPLPLAALRIGVSSVDGLKTLGFIRIGDLLSQPRAPLTLRFGPELMRRSRLREFDGSIGSIRLAHLRGAGVSDFRDRLRDAGVGIVTARKILGTLQRLLAYAVERDMIGVNVARGIKVIGRRDEGARKIVPPTKEAMRTLLAMAEKDFKVKLAFAGATGVRAGELHALRRKHIDLAKGEVTIETRVDAYGDEDVTKTSAGMRSVPLAQPLVLMLKEWKLRATWKKPDDLVFPNRRGRYTDHDHMVKRKFLPLFGAAARAHEDDEAGFPLVPARFNWHALRHFAVSCWIDAGLSPKTVQTFAGHSSLQVTMDRYGHLFKSDDHKKAMDAIAANMFR